MWPHPIIPESHFTRTHDSTASQSLFPRAMVIDNDNPSFEIHGPHLHVRSSSSSFPFSLYSTLTASSPSPTFSFISPSLSVPQGTNQLEQHDDNENEDPPQKSQAFNHFPTWVVLVPLHHHPLRCCELPKRRRFSNASHKIQPEPTQVTRMDRPGPMQMEPRVLLRRQTGYPNPNRAKQSPRHAP